MFNCSWSDVYLHFGSMHSNRNSVRRSVVGKMSDPSWLQPAPCSDLKPDWLSPSTGQSRTTPSCSKASPRKTTAAIAASATAAAAAAQAAQAASDLLVMRSGPVTPTKVRKPPSAASTQKTSKVESSAASGEGKDQQNAEEHIASVPCSERDDSGQPSMLAKNARNDAPHGRNTRNYAPRGSKGTFAGRRPPKNPLLLANFLKDKAEYLAKKELERATKQRNKMPKT